jgi:hypothetical protein
MTIWTPLNDGQITQAGPPDIPFDPEGPSSCVAYGYAYAISDATNGLIHPTGNQVRDWTGDHSGGLELDLCDAAVSNHLGLQFRTGVFKRGEFYSLLAKGYGAVMLIGYSAIAPTKFDGSPGFTGNHGWYVPPTRKIMDPLADGRRAGVYRYRGEPYPSPIIDAAAAALTVGLPPHQRRAGPDHFEASFIKLEDPRPPIKFGVTVDPGKIAYYPANLTARTVANAGAVEAVTKGFDTTCTTPLRFRWVGHGAYLTLVRLTRNPHVGMWINVGNPRVHLHEA